MQVRGSEIEPDLRVTTPLPPWTSFDGRFLSLCPDGECGRRSFYKRETCTEYHTLSTYSVRYIIPFSALRHTHLSSTLTRTKRACTRDSASHPSLARGFCLRVLNGNQTYPRRPPFDLFRVQTRTERDLNKSVRLRSPLSLCLLLVCGVVLVLFNTQVRVFAYATPRRLCPSDVSSHLAESYSRKRITRFPFCIG